MVKIYAMYKGNNCLATGTLYQLAKDLNISIQTLRFYLTPTYRKRFEKSKNRRELIRVE
jgi:DNA-binding CsgD family transcriptional regulator